MTERLSRTAGIVVALMGATVLIGWVAGVQPLTSLWAHTRPTKPMSALCLILGGLGLAIPRERIRLVAGAFIGAVGTATAIEHAFGIDLHIDRLALDVHNQLVRMTAMTAVSFMASGLALILLGRRTKIAHGLASAAIVFGFVAFTAHVVGVSSRYTITASSAMAFHTALAMMVLGLGILASHHMQGLTSTFADGGAGGLMVRRVLPIAIVLPLLSTWLAHEGVRLGLYDMRFSLSIDVVATVLILGTLILWTARQMQHLDALRSYAEEELRTMNIQLERTVEQRTAELGKSEQFYRVLSESISDLVIHMSVDGKITYASPTVLAMIGYTPEEMIGRTVMDFLPAESADDMAHVYGRVLNGEAASTRQPVFRKDGSQVWLEGVANPVINNKGVATGIIWIVRDVTEHIDAMERLREVAERERELNQLKNEFVGIVAHDLKSPMTVIGGFADILLSHWDETEPDERRDFLERIRDNTLRLSQMIDDVLQVSRIESGEITYQIEDFDLRMLLDETCDEIASVHPGRAINRTFPDDLPLAHADRDRTWRVVTNLVSNALKFSEDNAPVDICARPAGNDIEISIADHGFGIRPEDMSKLFQRFSRVEQPEGKRVKGTGLGLYISKSLVEGQGGTITAESEFGKGTTFRFTIPRAVDAT